MNILDYKDFLTEGEIKKRQELLFNRLHDTIYRPDYVFTADQNGWPGDWEGRTILALSSLAQALKTEPIYLDEIITLLKEKLNTKGYLGHILEDGYADEQQLSGHSWLLRGLCEYYRFRRDDSVLDIIKDIVTNLFLPLKYTYLSYPILPEQRVYEGAEAGNVAGIVGNWHISTDTGCAFIPLDGLSDAYGLMLDHDPALAASLLEMLNIMVTKFRSIPFTEICVQTHATLTGLRGLMRLFSLNKKYELLDFSASIFDLYIKEGMTANFANYNWFGRPEWTEPCAIIDSFMLACQLYAATKNARYTDYAQYILYNGIYHAQRDNGGFGTDTCAGSNSDYISCSIYEAYWCCTMRGGEGLASVSRYSMFSDDNTIFMIYPVSGTYTINGITMRVITDYPRSSYVNIRILENTNTANVKMRIILQSWDSSAKFFYNDSVIKQVITPETEEIYFEAKLPVYLKLAEGKHNIKEKKLLMQGPVILGSRNSDVCISDIESLNLPDFAPLYNTYSKEKSVIETEKIYILFNTKKD